MTRRRKEMTPAASQIRDPRQRLLTAMDRDRFTSLARSAADSERAAAAADAQRKASWRECQRLTVQAGLARGRHYSLANDARRTAAAAADARRTLRRAAVDAYVTWRRQHRNTPESAHERFLVELAEACATQPRDLLRLMGVGPSTRTIAERDDDFERYRAGWSMRAIAKARGIRLSAVQKDIHARLARLVEGQSSGVDRPTHNLPVVEHPQVTDQPVAAVLNASNPVNVPGHARGH
jgi:hypothetical protein